MPHAHPAPASTSLPLLDVRSCDTPPLTASTRPLSFNSRVANLEQLGAQVRQRLRSASPQPQPQPQPQQQQQPSSHALAPLPAPTKPASLPSLSTASLSGSSDAADSPATDSGDPLAMAETDVTVKPPAVQQPDESVDVSDHYTSASEEEQTTKPDSLAVEPKPPFAQTKSLVDVTLGDDDNDSTPEEATPITARPGHDSDASDAKDETGRPASTHAFPPIDSPLHSLPPKPEDIHDELIAPEDTQPPPPSPPKRKFTSPFSFFSRSTTSKSGDAPRRMTSSSVASGDLDDDATPRRPNRASLRDRFKILRMQEEAGVILDDDNEVRPVSAGTASVSEAPESPTDDVKSVSRKRMSSGARSQRSTAPIVNESLPPGTAAGTSTGPVVEGPVDWDLWQAVVYEGPAAVARSSADELNTAIRKGIPSAIRGVVWQVLAQSKNEDLETVYRELVARSAEDPTGRRPSTAGKRPVSSLSHRPSVAGSAAASVKDLVPSSDQSSEHEPHSPNGRSVQSSPTTPMDTNGIDIVKAQAKIAAEEKKKARDEAAALNKLEKAIKRDLGARTSYSKFLMSQGLQNGLFGICKAYALFDEEVGYAQGMNFIAMPLLFNMPEEEAFTLFVRLMNHYKLRDLFVADMPGLHLHLYQFGRLLEDFEPALYCHLNRRGVHPQLYATQWFLTLFAYRFPLQLVLRIYDLILSEGLESAILKFGIVLMQKNANQLLEMRDMTALTQFLKEKLFDVYIDKSPSANSVLESGFFGSTGGIDKEVYRADQLVHDACSINVTKETLALYTREWEEKTREEKAVQQETESLRSTSARLVLENKVLRARTEELDTEHVTIASELVRTKVLNQHLADDNEALRTQVKDLQSIISSQPGEVEDRLRQEMDRIIQRNTEVQGQNRVLEEEREQVENELVRTKMEKAEIQEELEKWKQKWQTVAGMIKETPSP